ncbi:hypothetical protein FWK35_00008396, partial [Aphis craccivora]
YEKPCIKFSILSYLYKKFYELYLQNNLQIFRNLTNFCQYLNFKCYLKKILPMYSYNFLITIKITYKELCIKFSSILIGSKKFYRHFKKKIFRKIENFSCL